MSVSSLTGSRIADVWTTLKSIHGMLKGDGRLTRLRQEQARRWFWSEIQTVISETILSDASLARETEALEAMVSKGEALPYAAARKLVGVIRR
jgi:putative protein kinase ArgK-like GTPase of G3E family